jgi:hypothetical protein
VLANDINRTSKQISRERQIQTGEVFTPPETTNEMLDLLEQKLFTAGYTFLEPAAGDGNIVQEIFLRKLKCGCTAEEALSDIYAIEYMKDNYDFLCRRLLTLAVNHGGGDVHRCKRIINTNFAYANTLDPSDTSEGRKYPEWLLEDEHEEVSLFDLLS